MISRNAARRVATIAARRSMSQAALFHVLCWQGHGRKSLALIASFRNGENQMWANNAEQNGIYGTHLMLVPVEDEPSRRQSGI
jgi:hypothetical protein